MPRVGVNRTAAAVILDKFLTHGGKCPPPLWIAPIKTLVAGTHTSYWVAWFSPRNAGLAKKMSEKGISFVKFPNRSSVFTASVWKSQAPSSQA